MCEKVGDRDRVADFLGDETACLTQCRTVIPKLICKTPEDSLAIFIRTNRFRFDTEGKKIIGRNPLEPIPYSEKGQFEMLRSMGLGLEDDATILWVQLLGSFKEKRTMHDDKTTGDDLAVENNANKMLELMDSGWVFDNMMGVQIALPNGYSDKGDRATHWLVCQPLSSADKLRWNILKRDALGVWKTETKVYFVVPVGYQNILFVEKAEDGKTLISKEEFFEESAANYRKECQKFLDDFKEEENKRKNRLLELIDAARGIAKTYAQALDEVAPEYFGNEMPPALLWNEDNEEFVYGEERVKISEESVDEFGAVLKQLQTRVTECRSLSQKVDSFRAILEDLTGKITVKDLGKVTQTADVKKGPNVMVELTLTEAILTVAAKKGKTDETHFAYDDQGSASAFYNELERLNLVKREEEAKEKQSKGIFRFLQKLHLTPDTNDAIPGADAAEEV